MLPDHPEIDTFQIGIIDFTESVNESEVGDENSRYRIKKVGACKVEVYSGEGSIPHFHITGISNTFNCCVRIYDNHFFSHGNKNRDTLNSQQCKDLNEWLKQNNPRMAVPMTNWQSIKSMWESANPDCKFPERLKVDKQPDYSTMSLFRDSI